MSPPVFYYDISSPYAYLAAERIGTVLPEADWQPILIGGLFKLNGRTSWIFSEERESRMAEIDERAERYGLPPITWPTGLPDNQLGLQRAATVARRHGRAARPRGVSRNLCPWRRSEQRSGAARSRGRGRPGRRRADSRHRRAGGQGRAAADDRARPRAGSAGVPTVVVDGAVFWGDDRLEEAAAAAR